MQHYVCVCLVTIVQEGNQYRYIHPYTLEDISNQGYPDVDHNAIWYPIGNADIDGIKRYLK